MNTPNEQSLQKIYGANADTAKVRFAELCSTYGKIFGDAELSFFSAPGRTEIIGNHTDHNGGKVIAASIDLDTIGAAAKNGTSTINIASKGYPHFSVNLDNLSETPKESGTRSLVAGMAECARNKGFKVEGFDLCASTTVIAAAGVSSSASFEMLVMSVINHLFNDDTISFSDYAIIGQYSENVWWNKASGRMDQMACAVGGPILLDFAGEIQYDKIPFGFDNYGYSMVITNTGGGHSDLSAEYSAVPGEMFEVAKALGKEKLCETDMNTLLENWTDVSSKVSNDRAMLRAMHFLAETQRVSDMSKMVEKNDIDGILKLISKSGQSSYDLLQNCYVPGDTTCQPITIALALTNHFLEKTGAGVCRVHGGGFAGVIQTIIPDDQLDSYVDYMSKYFGKENVYPMNIRQTGATVV